LVIPPKISGVRKKIPRQDILGDFAMKNGRFSDAQIMGILKQAEGGVPVSELCREHGMSSASFYKWRAKFGGMDASMISELKDMADQNKRLKKMYAELSMQNDLLKEALGKKH
jgi:putative transposase